MDGPIAYTHIIQLHTRTRARSRTRWGEDSLSDFSLVTSWLLQTTVNCQLKERNHMPRSAVSPNKEVQSTRSLLKWHGFKKISDVLISQVLCTHNLMNSSPGSGNSLSESLELNKLHYNPRSRRCSKARLRSRTISAWKKSNWDSSAAEGSICSNVQFRDLNLAFYQALLRS